MKITVAVDSFKGSLSTFQSGEAIKEGIERVFPDAVVNICPLADGGEGTVEAIVSATGGEIRTVTVHDPLGRPIKSSYGMLRETQTAVIEMSKAAGITLIDEKDRNPLHTTTYGVGELILDALSEGIRNFIIGIGGSATNDGGLGMLQALGFSFLDEAGNEVPFGAKGLQKIAEIKNDKASPLLRECRFHIACDVKNVLCGKEGASAVYGPQKGATPQMVKEMDQWLGHFARLTKGVNPEANPEAPGSGAAGGLGFAFLSYLNGTLESGVDLVIEATKLEDFIKDADIVITGEGRLDGQSAMGKAPVGVARLAKKHHKPVIAFSGAVTPEASACNAHGIDAFFPILRTPCTLADAMDCQNAAANLSATTEQVFRLIKTFM